MKPFDKLRARYEILEHRADLKIRVFGREKPELFCNALFGMSESMKTELKKPEQEAKREIKIKAVDLATLLVDFLNEALYLSQTNKEAYFEVNFSKFSDVELEGELVGQKVGSFGEDIKAVTHHDLKIRQREDKTWTATVLFDV